MNTTIPENVTSIGAEAFSGCDSLKSISIPDGVNSIGNGAFMQCSSLETVAFSGSVVKIGASAFAQCYNWILLLCQMVLKQLKVVLLWSVFLSLQSLYLIV